MCRVQVSQLYVFFSATSLSGDRSSLRRPKLDSEGHDFDFESQYGDIVEGFLTWFAMKLQPRIQWSVLNDLSPNHELPSRVLQHHMALEMWLSRWTMIPWRAHSAATASNIWKTCESKDSGNSV
jgi:hypothetical protein